MTRNALWKVLFAAAATAVATVSALAAGWDDGAGDDWKALLAKAKQEGPLVLGACPEFATNLAKAFKADTGLDVVVLQGDTNEISNRLRVEIESGRNVMDVHSGGATEIDMVGAGKIYPLKDLLILPSVVKGENWRGGKIAWVDNAQKYMVVTQQYVSTRPIFNRDVVAPSSLKVMDDLLKPEWKGKIAAIDPTVGGSGQSAATYWLAAKGDAYFEKLYKGQQVVITSDQRQLAEWAARGLYPIVLGLDPQYIERFRQQGITSLAVFTPDDAPGSLNGGCGVTELPANIPHPAAAAVFVNWLLSPNGQKVMVEATQLPSRRIDVSTAGVPEYFIPSGKIEYLDQYQQDWYLTQRVALREKVKSILAK